MLLAHSHALANITDQLLIEMTHTPLALFGITAGWSRWLELRTERQVKTVCSWLWPICFSLVGLVLLTYREV
jgi:putative copper resistance protein D